MLIILRILQRMPFPEFHWWKGEEKKEVDSECQFALKWCISYKKSHYNLMPESLEGKILYCEGSICVMWCKYLLLLNR